MGDLRLSLDEATTLLNGSLELNLTTDQILALVERTEGWAAGLQLVGLSLRGRRDPEAYIASLAGDDRQIVDYLVAEVLERQSPEVREFLLCTSIVSRLTGPLCDALVRPRLARGTAWWSWSEPTCSWSPWMTAAFGTATTTCSVSCWPTSSPWPDLMT